MRKIVTRVTAGILLMLIALAPLGPVVGRPLALPPECQELAFSTEEDFVTQGPVPPDGNAIISDGDLLGRNCLLCARNADLLAETFDVTVDLGLDAADIVDVETSLIAFSTELNSPHLGQFTQGDLLVTNGVIIPNQALTYAFGQGVVGYDIGLDAVHFVGDGDSILGLLGYLQTNPIQDPGKLSDLLKEFGVDIWFSTEGTWQVVGAPSFLDGDLLSARDGTIVAGNKTLLPTGVPAGIPDRGVDFGLDAVTTDRTGNQELIHFSTEILFDGEPSFTDGDVLKAGNGVIYTNSQLVTCFEPKADFLGLDALHMVVEDAFRFHLYMPVILRDQQ
jgi:hypothetical protein